MLKSFVFVFVFCVETFLSELRLKHALLYKQIRWLQQSFSIIVLLGERGVAQRLL